MRDFFSSSCLCGVAVDEVAGESWLILMYFGWLLALRLARSRERDADVFFWRVFAGLEELFQGWFCAEELAESLEVRLAMIDPVRISVRGDIRRRGKEHPESQRSIPSLSSSQPVPPRVSRTGMNSIVVCV